ncbi:MAG: sulfide/dihydroorotate dehydrogenase-like FAD/NAD-binding protein [Gemmatimonadota bacterium]|nr:sulfide/dihydroorotate dehydrogenase-like FAD/NAD-binding protein [Gemmatimonadota bacterium]MDP7030763.1 sulfide/dihydroorotate dehydrogenase-like FAD/NAD-binding protein [Gemmatimonadota bacterium]
MPNRIVTARELAENVMLFEIEARHIAERGQAGQFVILRVSDRGERIPLTIAHRNPERGTITLVVQQVGKTTDDMNLLREGDEILDLAGPLGKPTEIPDGGKTVVCVGGGIGIAVVWPMAEAFRAAGNRVVSVLGAREKGLLILEDEVRAVSDDLIITTDDGSYGKHGLVTNALQDMIDAGEKIDEVVCIGPVIMMKFVCKTTEPHDIPTLVSLNPIMVDGTGMCGACRVTVGGETQFACVEGPEFDGHQVDFDELMSRLAYYHDEEALARERGHRCRLAALADRPSGATGEQVGTE